MVRSMTYAKMVARLRGFAAASALALPALASPAVARAQADARPVVVVFTFDNNSIGKDRADYDNLSKGVQDLLITDMASSAKFRLVDRARIQELLQEQNLVKSGAVDPQTAIRLGKMLGAQYAITGGFLADTRSGNAVLTGRTIDMETSQIGNPQKVTGKTDDVLGLIGQLSSRLASDMNLAPKPGRRVGDAGGASGEPASPKTSPAQSGAAASSTKSLAVETFAKPVAAKSLKTKLDASTMRIYSNALDEVDHKNPTKAAALFRQVLAKFPDFEPAKDKLEKISTAG